MPSLSKLLKDLQFAVQAAINVEGQLKDKQFFNDLENVLKTAQKGVTDATGGALHRLNVTKPSIDTVKELILGIPGALSFKNEGDQLPIQSAVWDKDSIKYVPILAKVGIKHEVGGRGMRGGLLAVDPTDADAWNTLQCLAVACEGWDDEEPIPSYDTARLEAMKELRKENMLWKKDIKDHHLLYSSCYPGSKMRWEYLAEWDPDCLMIITYEYLPISHAIIKREQGSIDAFTVYFQTALKYHPQHLGFLFQKDGSGQTAFERFHKKHGNDTTFNVIKQCIPTDTKLPILHHVIKDAPQFMNDFSLRYISAMYLRDADGRTLTQAAISSGAKTFKSDTMFFGKMTDDEIAELDPITKQYPFLTCAACETSDLFTIYFLLSKNPSLLEKYIEQTTDEFAEEARSRKRKRDSDDDNDGGGDVKE